MIGQQQSAKWVPVFLCLILISCIWLLPGWMICYYAWGGDRYVQSDQPGDSASGLLDSPPPWAKAPDDAHRWLKLAGRSIRLSLTTACMAVPCALVTGLILGRSQWAGVQKLRRIWYFLIFLPLPMTATAWLGAVSNLGRSQAFGLSREPLISGWSAAALVHAVAVLPLLTWIFAAVMQRTDTGLEELARLDYAGFKAFFRSVFIQLRPAVWAGGVIVMIMTAGDMTVTDLVQERTFAEESYLQAQMGDGLAAAARTAMPPVIVVAGLLLFWWWFNHQWLSQCGGRAVGGPSNREWLTGFWAKFGGWSITLFSGVVWGLPLLALVWRSGRAGGMAQLEQLPKWSLVALFHNLSEAWPDLAETLPATLFIAASVSFIAVIASWFVVECAVQSRTITVLLILSVALGLATPGPVAGLAVAWFWMPLRFVYDSSLIIILAQLFRLMPVSVLLFWPMVLFRDEQMRDLIRVDGPNWSRVFWQVALPSMGPLLVAGFFIISALSLGELPASNLVAPPGVEIFSVRLWGLMHTGLESHLASVVLLALLVMMSLAMFSFIVLKQVRARIVSGSVSKNSGI